MEVNEHIFEGFSAVRMEVNENIFLGFLMTNEKKLRKTKCVSNDRSRHDDSNGPRIVKIGAILAIFEHFKVWTSAQDLRARSRKTFRARPRLVNFFYKLLYMFLFSGSRPDQDLYHLDTSELDLYGTSEKQKMSELYFARQRWSWKPCCNHHGEQQSGGTFCCASSVGRWSFHGVFHCQELPKPEDLIHHNSQHLMSNPQCSMAHTAPK